MYPLFISLTVCCYEASHCLKLSLDKQYGSFVWVPLPRNLSPFRSIILGDIQTSDIVKRRKSLHTQLVIACEIWCATRDLIKCILLLDVTGSLLASLHAVVKFNSVLGEPAIIVENFVLGEPAIIVINFIEVQCLRVYVVSGIVNLDGRGFI